MHKSVIAIGLDAAEPAVLEGWLAEGRLPNLAKLRARGAYGRIQNQKKYRAETPWTTFLTGVWPEQTGYWGPAKYDAANYALEYVSAYKFDEQYQPFYALGDRRKVAVFDMPQSVISPAVNGVQVLAWGAHSPQTPSVSSPASLFDELVQQHGEHPAFGQRDRARVYSRREMKVFYERLVEGIRRRTAICCDLLRRDRWDLFLTIFGEAHSAGHNLWHLNQTDHPLYATYGQGQENYFLKTFEAIDRAIGDILAAAPADASVVVFSAHGTQSNNMDAPSGFFLPELLYRWSFPGKIGFSSPLNSQPTAPTLQNLGKWYKSAWAQRHGLNPLVRRFSELAPTPLQRAASLLTGNAASGDLLSPYARKNRGGNFDWQPVSWYAEAWPRMKAFALPTFSDGYIRVNLQGRDPSGIVQPTDYESVCDELEGQLLALTNPHSGQPVVERVVRTRQICPQTHTPVETERLPDADLIVLWNEAAVTDCMESDRLGRFGPVAFQRTGSHSNNGFVLIQGEGIEPNGDLAPGEAVDLAPTILELMAMPAPSHFVGKSLVHKSTYVPV